MFLDWIVIHFYSETQKWNLVLETGSLLPVQYHGSCLYHGTLKHFCWCKVKFLQPLSNLLRETLEYLPCTISAFSSLNNPCSNSSCRLTAGWWISKIIPGRQDNSYHKRYCTFNAKYITSRKQKFDSVLHPCCIQVFLKWNDSQRPRSVPNSSATCLFSDDLHNAGS